MIQWIFINPKEDLQLPSLDPEAISDAGVSIL